MINKKFVYVLSLQENYDETFDERYGGFLPSSPHAPKKLQVTGPRVEINGCTTIPGAVGMAKKTTR